MSINGEVDWLAYEVVFQQLKIFNGERAGLYLSKLMQACWSLLVRSITTTLTLTRQINISINLITCISRNIKYICVWFWKTLSKSNCRGFPSYIMFHIISFVPVWYSNRFQISNFIIFIYILFNIKYNIFLSYNYFLVFNILIYEKSITRKYNYRKKYILILYLNVYYDLLYLKKNNFILLNMK